MFPRIPVPAALLLLLSACASSARTSRPALPPPAREIRTGARDPGAGSEPPLPTAKVADREVAVRTAIETARALLGQREISLGTDRFGDDCAALVRAALSRAGSPLPPGTQTAGALHALARQRSLLRKGAPEPGDVVFLADRPGGSPVHAGIVESVGADGTAMVLHRTGRGVARLRINASHPWTLRGDRGRLLNDPLVTGAGRVPAGRLFVAWASLY
jgi:hypothetical protein